MREGERERETKIWEKRSQGKREEGRGGEGERETDRIRDFKKKERERVRTPRAREEGRERPREGGIERPEDIFNEFQSYKFITKDMQSLDRNVTPLRQSNDARPENRVLNLNFLCMKFGRAECAHEYTRTDTHTNARGGTHSRRHASHIDPYQRCGKRSRPGSTCSIRPAMLPVVHVRKPCLSRKLKPQICETWVRNTHMSTLNVNTHSCGHGGR